MLDAPDLSKEKPADYGAPAEDSYSAPDAPEYKAPEEPKYKAPEAPKYKAPEAPKKEYGAPAAPEYAPPVVENYNAADDESDDEPLPTYGAYELVHSGTVGTTTPKYVNLGSSYNVQP